jgi:hypothetical protein
MVFNYELKVLYAEYFRWSSNHYVFVYIGKHIQDTVREVKGLSFMHSAFGFRNPFRLVNPQ